MILFILLCVVTDSVKMLEIFMLIMTVHESGHYLTARIFHYPLQQFTITPLGLKMTLTYFGYRDAFSEMLILMAGPGMQCLVPLLLSLSVSLGLCSTAMKEWGIMMNNNIMMFNLLPLYPLDGGRIVQSVLHCLFPYRTAQRITLVLSVLLVPALYFFVRIGRKAVFVLAVIGILDLVTLFFVRRQACSFYLYRLFHPVKYSVLFHQRNDLYRQRCNRIMKNNKIMTEKEWILQYLQKNEK